jgi:hypothetical protein
MKGWRRLTLLGLMGFGVAVLPAAVADASTQPPRLLNADAGSLVVRPNLVSRTRDWSAFFGVRRGPGRLFGHLTWKRWGLTQANATGRFWIEHCHPTCGDRTYTSSPVRLHAWHAERYLFTRLTANGPRIHRTFHILDTYGGFIWAWPGGAL